jgi:hypothetical protein
MTLFVFVMAGIAVRRTASLPLAYSAFLWLHFPFGCIFESDFLGKHVAAIAPTALMHSRGRVT